ncbi:hypothetical protein Golomagni_06641 [Golovinomyces magnicellulatus]|nr:hypothetical protein Golomagni_06641 [Golovinomyces magnicellulatus]
MLCTRCLRATGAARRQLSSIRTFSIATRLRSAEPTLSTPVTQPGEQPQESAKPRSICLEGTVLSGLNYNKGGQDPVAKKDEDYPQWLWSCLDVMKTGSDAADEDAGDEFCSYTLPSYGLASVQPRYIQFFPNSQIKEAETLGSQAPKGARSQTPRRGQPRSPAAQDPYPATINQLARQRGQHPGRQH